MKIIGITGWPCSGKTYVSKIFENNGYVIISTGDVLRGLVGKYKWDASDLIGLGKYLREKFGDDFVIKECIQRIKNENLDKVVVEGLRPLIEDKELRKEFGNNYRLIGVVCKKETRIERGKERGRIDDKELYEKDEREKRQYQVDKLIEKADILIDNDGSLEELEKNTKKVLELIENEI